MIGERSKRIADLNDAFRQSILVPPNLGCVFTAHHFEQKGGHWQRVALHAVANFSEFSDDNDPSGERGTDAIPMTVEGVEMLWKIDYYDREFKDPSPDPSDPDVTLRIITLMLPEDY